MKHFKPILKPCNFHSKCVLLTSTQAKYAKFFQLHILKTVNMTSLYSRVI